MKIDRLLGIVMFLMNREKVSARQLAQRFDVSIRTIQRDIDSLTLAGIPIYAEQGVKGGYALLDNYCLDYQLMTFKEYLYIMKALQSLSSGVENQAIENALEKVMALVPAEKKKVLKEEAAHMTVDLGVLRESDTVNFNVDFLHNAIKKKQTIEIQYTAADTKCTNRIIDPLMITFKWHAWYLLAYCHLRKDYRLFRVSRIREISSTEEKFSKKYFNRKQILEDLLSETTQKMVTITLYCKAEILVSLQDYFHNGTIEKQTEEGFVFTFEVPMGERFWFGILMSFGDQLKVLSPKSVQQRLLTYAEKIKNNY